jgi:lipoprotein NlpD
MSFYHSKLNFIVIQMVLALMNACTTETYYAPVKTDNKEFAQDRKNPVISEQDLNNDNPAVTRDIKKYHVEKNWRTFPSRELSSGDGFQRLALQNQKSPSCNIKVGRKIKLPHPDTGDRVNDKKQKTTAAKNVHKKRQIKLDVAKKSKRQQQKSISSIDNKKMLELNFGWPIKGRVLKSFSPTRNKGIDIAGKKGQPVKATETGKVVYAGQGLIGFGKLLIIRHNDIYLSAYANNSQLLVSEGQHVEKGQVIAEVGDVGIKRTSLHFQIRKNGKPVNPIKFLPKK